LTLLQLDEDELNQLRDYIKERRRQYREQVAMYDTASANMANRVKTAASGGAPKKMNKRDKRKLRAGIGGGGNSRPVTPANAGLTPRSGVFPAKTPKTGQWGGRVSDGEPHRHAEPTSTSLITQMAFRTVEHEVRSLPYATPPINSKFEFNANSIHAIRSRIWDGKSTLY